ncbi:MAG: hypothetical protein K8W52_42045 [Deltaproteobacteria bacterium]|nr:hypothetical protein [Deltaproteobacteria bacterium]
MRRRGTRGALIGTMTPRAALLLTCAALGACDAERAAPDAPIVGCDGGSGLHVVVDLSAPLCQGIIPAGPDWAIDVGAGGATLRKTDAVYVHPSYAPNRIELFWRWPPGTPDGLEAQISWYGTGDGQTIGTIQQPYQVHRDQCVDVTIVPMCTVGTDAGVPDATL